MEPNSCLFKFKHPVSIFYRVWNSMTSIIMDIYYIKTYTFYLPFGFKTANTSQALFSVHGTSQRFMIFGFARRQICRGLKDNISEFEILSHVIYIKKIMLKLFTFLFYYSFFKTYCKK